MTQFKLLENNPNMYYGECPWCGLLLEVPVNQLNCRIFRHGGTGPFQPIHPHAPQGRYVPKAPAQAPEWGLDGNQIFGCGQPFRVDIDLVARRCGWI